MKKFVLILSIGLLSLFGCEDDPVKSENHNPVILSLTFFPEIVKPNDSLIVICNAFDPDADNLVYDWYSTGVVKIKGLPSWDCCALFNTYENSQIFYAPDSAHVSAPQDTFRVECAARDGIGGMAVQSIRFIVKKDS